MAENRGSARHHVAAATLALICSSAAASSQNTSIYDPLAERVAFADRSRSLVAAQYLNWVHLMALGAAEGLSDAHISGVIEAIDRETFESQDARSFLLARVHEAMDAGIGDQLRGASVLVAFSMQVPNYDFERREFQFCFPNTVEVPSQSNNRFPSDQPSVRVWGGFRMGGFEGITRGYRAYFPPCDTTRGSINDPWARRFVPLDAVVAGAFPLPTSSAGVAPGQFGSVHLDLGLIVQLEPHLARPFFESMSQRGYVQMAVVCDLNHVPAPASRHQSYPKTGMFSCAAQEFVLGYLEEGGDMLRARRVGSDWTWSYGSGFPADVPRPATATPAETAAPEADEVTVGAEPDTEAPTEVPVAVTGADSEAEPPVPAADAATDLPGLMAQAEALYGQALAAPQAQRPARMAEVQAVLDRIVDEHPTSDEAVAVLLGLPLGTIPTAEVAALAATAPAAEARTETPENDAAAGVDPVAALSTCYRLALVQGQAVAAEVSITIHAQIGPAGELVGIPTLAMPATPDATARRMFQNALAALDLCAPPTGELLPEELALATQPLQPFASRQIAVTFDDSQVVTISPMVPSQGRPAVSVIGMTPESTVEGEAQPAWRAAGESDEARMNLTRVQGREVQGRLTAMGFDPRGVDGAIGRGTRSAIAAWQRRNGIPETGFLDERQWAELREQSQEQFAAWVRNNPTLAPEAQPSRASTRPTGRYFDRRGCLREANGRIVRNFRSDCR